MWYLTCRGRQSPALGVSGKACGFVRAKEAKEAAREGGASRTALTGVSRTNMSRGMKRLSERLVRAVQSGPDIELKRDNLSETPGSGTPSPCCSTEPQTPRSENYSSFLLLSYSEL